MVGVEHMKCILAPNVQLVNQFINVGINNTLHKIYLTINAKVEMNLPIKKQVININQQVLLCESVIVGKVPNIYLGGMSDKVLNLIPS